MNYFTLWFISFTPREPERGTHFSRDLRRRSRSRSPMNRRERMDPTARTGSWTKDIYIEIEAFLYIYIYCSVISFTFDFLLVDYLIYL